MKSANIEDMKERIAFIEKAAEAFANQPNISTYTDGPLMAGCYFAVRWGLGDDCILLLTLDADEIPEVYGQVIPQPEPEPQEPYKGGIETIGRRGFL